MKSVKMYIIFQISCLSFLTTGIISCNNSGGVATAETDISRESPQQLIFDKLIGTWQSEDGKSFERWTNNNDGTYQTEGFSVKGGDTSWNEKGSVYQENNNWVFENTVKDQNDGKSVKFTSTLLNETSVQFSNPVHDFPTDINYTVADAATLRAFIVGPNNKGGKDTIPFNFTRVK